MHGGLDRSLDQIDLLQVHNTVSANLLAELFDCMEDLTVRGLVRYWGSTVYEEIDAEQVVESGRFHTVQVPFSLLDQRMRRRLFPACLNRGIGLVFRSVFLKGILSHRHANLPPKLDQLQPQVVRLNDVAQDSGLTLAELAFRFAAFAPCDHITLFGTTSVEETEENLAMLRRGPLGADVLDALAELEFDDELLTPVYSTAGWTMP